MRDPPLTDVCTFLSNDNNLDGGGLMNQLANKPATGDVDSTQTGGPAVT